MTTHMTALTSLTYFSLHSSVVSILFVTTLTTVPSKLRACAIAHCSQGSLAQKICAAYKKWHGQSDVAHNSSRTAQGLCLFPQTDTRLEGTLTLTLSPRRTYSPPVDDDLYVLGLSLTYL